MNKNPESEVRIDKSVSRVTVFLEMPNSNLARNAKQ